jgi:hypothetical protein
MPAGGIWLTGIALSIVALPELGLAVAAPLSQAGLFVAGAPGCLIQSCDLTAGICDKHVEGGFSVTVKVRL